MADSHVSRGIVFVSLGITLFVVSSSAYPYHDFFNPTDNAHEFNTYYNFDDDHNEIYNYKQGIGGSSGGDSSNEYGYGPSATISPGGGGGGGGGGGTTGIPGGGGGGGPVLTPVATNGPQPPVVVTAAGPLTPCRGDTCGGNAVVPNGAEPRAGLKPGSPGQPLAPRIPRTNKPKIFTIANNIAQSQGGPLGLSFSTLVAAVAVAGVLLVAAVGLVAFVCARRR